MNSRMSRNRLAEAFSSESPAHRWRAPVRQTLKSHRNGQRWSLSAVASSCLVPSQAVSRRLRPSSTVPVITGASRSCPWSDEREACSTQV